MPYYTKKIDENKYCVYKKSDDSLVGCTTSKEKLKKYLKALHVNEPKNTMKKPIFNYIQNDIEADGVATLHLYDTIGAYYDPETESIMCTINGRDFAKEIEYLQDKVTRIDVKINSGGGNVLDGFAIIDSILNSKIPVYTYNVGIAASIASLIFLAGRKRLMNDYSMLMIHNPSMSENENSKLLNVIKKQLMTFLGNNCTYTEQELSDLMDEETYFDATQCLDSNLVDEIITTERDIKVDKTNVLEMAKIYNSIIKEKDMKKVKNTADKTDKDATFKEEKVVIKKTSNTTEAEKEEESETPAEEQKEQEEGTEKSEPVHQPKDEEKITKETKTVVNDDESDMDDDSEDDDDDMDEVYGDMDEAMAKIKALKEDLKASNEKVAKYEAEAAKNELEKVDNMLNHYVALGSIKADEVSNLKKLAKVDFDAVNNMLSKIDKTATKTKPLVNKEAVKIFDSVLSKPNAVTGKESWTIRDWEKKDPEGLKRIKNETPELYNSMFTAYYKK